ncbi:MAG: DUF6549 family protein [Alistipes sp.]
MKRYLLLTIAILSLIIWAMGRHVVTLRQERNRLQRNQEALMSDVEHYKTESGKNAASVEMLELRKSEVERHYSDLMRTCKDLKIKVNRLQSASTTSTTTTIEVKTIVRDTVILRDTLRLFRWHDTWVRVEGLIGADSVQCRVESVDTLQQIVHRIPRRFLFFRWGTKAIRQEIVSTNPHTQIVYSEYIEMKK